MSNNRPSDIINCLANLSSDEVFTPPKIVNDMLDMLPEEIWSDAFATFLDPCCKSGVFLREIVSRLNNGLKHIFPDTEERIKWILGNQIYGIAITELTSLVSRRTVYCSMDMNSRFSIYKRDNDCPGMIHFNRIKHTFKNSKCIHCGASESEYDREEGKETHAYEFIHNKKLIEELWGKDMKFDVIIGNPPYQLKDGGNGASAKPLYHKFVERAKELNPKYLCMIIPSRWYIGGKGLDDFREDMMCDTRIKELHDFLDSKECFPKNDIKGGICYFLWDREHNGECLVVNEYDESRLSRNLKEDGLDTVIGPNKAISIYNKVKEKNTLGTFDSLVSARKPFGFDTKFKGFDEQVEGMIPMYSRKRKISYVPRKLVTVNTDWIDKHKVLIAEASEGKGDRPNNIISPPFKGTPGYCCNETYLVIGPFDDETTCNNVISYINTKFFRFLISLKKTTQHGTQKVYSLVPLQDFSKPWTDEELYKIYELEDDEIKAIESNIKPRVLDDICEDDNINEDEDE